MIHILDGKNKTILDTITHKNVTQNKHRRSLEDYLESFEFTALADKSFANHLTNRNRLIIPSEDQGYVEFIIDEVVKKRGPNGLKVRVLSLASYLELKKASVVEPQTLTDYTPTTAVSFATNSTEWRPGRIESGDAHRTFNISTHTNPFAFLKTIANEFDLELNFRTETRGGRVVGRYVDLLDRVGDWKGREITFGKDLEGIERKEDVSNVYTALLCLGPEDEDGNRLETLVEDREALQRWGRPNPITGELKHLIDVYEPQSERSDMTLEELRQYGRTELNKRIESVVTYECDIVDLENVPGMENKKIRFGDTIRIKDEKFNPPLYVEARVFEQQRDIFTKANKHVKLGDFTEFTEEEVTNIRRQLQAQINARVSFNELKEYTYNKDEIEQRDLTVYNNSKDYADTAVENVEIDDSNFRDDQPPTPQNVVAEGFFKVISVKWDYNNSSTIASYEVYASQTPGFTPALSNMVWSGKAGGIMFEAETNEIWFFRVRAVNTRGTASGYSSEVSAETTRIQNIDVEIGAINAEKLDDLAVTAEKLADDSVETDKIATDAVTETKIQDDSISTPKLKAQSVTANEIEAGTITAESGIIADAAIGNAAIQNGAISNAKIGNGAITNAKIANATITSAKIHSVTADKLDVADLSAISADLGTITAGEIYGAYIEGATIRQQGSQNYIEINNDGIFIKDNEFHQPRISIETLDMEYEGGGYFPSLIRFEKNVGEYNFAIGTNGAGLGTGFVGFLEQGSSNRSFEIANPGGALYFPSREARFTGDVETSGSIKVGGGTGQWVFTNAVDNTVRGTHLYLRTQSSGEIRTTVNATTDNFIPLRTSQTIYESGHPHDYTTTLNVAFLNNNGRLRYEQSNGQEIFAIRGEIGAGNDKSIRLMGLDNYTTSASANLYISGAYNVIRSTSARKYKKNIQPLEDYYAENFFEKAQPVWFQSKCNADPKHYGYYGYIADDVAEFEPRLVKFKDYDEDGNPLFDEEKGETPEVEGFHYDRVPALLHTIMKKDRQRLSECEVTIDKLKKRLEMLENESRRK